MITYKGTDFQNLPKETICLVFKGKLQQRKVVHTSENALKRKR